MTFRLAAWLLCALLATTVSAQEPKLTRGAHYLVVVVCTDTEAGPSDCITHTPPVTYSSSKTCEAARAELERRLSTSTVASVICMTVFAE